MCGALLAQDSTAGTIAAVASFMSLSVFLQVICTAVVSGYAVCLLSMRRECGVLVAHDSEAHVSSTVAQKVGGAGVVSQNRNMACVGESERA